MSEDSEQVTLSPPIQQPSTPPTVHLTPSCSKEAAVGLGRCHCVCLYPLEVQGACRTAGMSGESTLHTFSFVHSFVTITL